MLLGWVKIKLHRFDPKTLRVHSRKTCSYACTSIWWERMIPSIPACHHLASSPEAEAQTAKCRWPCLPYLPVRVSYQHWGMCFSNDAAKCYGGTFMMPESKQSASCLKARSDSCLYSFNILPDTGSKHCSRSLHQHATKSGQNRFYLMHVCMVVCDTESEGSLWFWC